MNLKKVLIVYKDSTLKEHSKTISEAGEILDEYGIKNIFLERSKFNKECVKDHDLILGVGGDGTLLGISHFVNDTVVLGVNFDSRTSEGMFCSATRHDLREKLARIIDGKFGIKKLTRARVFLINAGQSYDALNEIYVGSAKPYRISRYILKFGEGEEEQKSSGVIVATGAGSTAWYGSAVKENFDPEMKKLRFVIREPYHGKLAKFNLINGKLSEGEKLYIKSKMINGVVAADSMIEAPLGNEEEVEISVSPEPFKLILF